MFKQDEIKLTANYLNSEEHHEIRSHVNVKINEGYTLRGTKIDINNHMINYVLRRNTNSKDQDGKSSFGRGE